MLNKLADAIIAENFDALQNSKENISSPNLKLSKHQGSFTCFNEIKMGIDIKSKRVLPCTVLSKQF